MSQNVSTVTSSFAAASLGESSESNVGINSSFASSQSSHIKSSAWSNVPQPNLPPPPSSSSSQHHHHPHQSPWNRHPLQLNEQYHQQASSEASVSSDTHHHHHHHPPPHRVSGDIRNRVSGDIRQQAGYDTRRSRGRAPPHHHHHHHARSSRERDHNVEKELFGDPDSIQTGINFKKYDDIPVEVSGSNIPDGVSSFHDIQLHPVLQRNVTLCRYTHPTPVQKHALPVGMAARDLMACAQTGSGKTAAFLLPALHRVLSGNLKNTARMTKYQSGNGQRRITRRRSTPSILVLAPTRELAAQIYTEARKFCYCSPLNAVVVYGGQDAIVQLRELELGCDVLVATPGRLCDFIERGRISLANISVLVFDEADRMLDMGFEPQIRRIVEEEDLRSNHQTLMFSATFPAQIQQLAQDYLNDYVFLAVGRVGSTTDSISQCIEYAADRDKKRMLLRILPQCEGLTLIFVDTKRMADSLEDWLINQGVNTTSIHGDRSQDEREYSLLEFREGRCPVLVATDVASRGLDIPNVLHVINFDFPSQIDDYVHRIGRTGRCGNTGTATSFINERNQAVLIPLYDMLKENNQVVPAFLEQMMASKDFGSNGNRHNGARRSGRRNNSRYSARDARRGHTETYDTRPHHNTNTQWNEQSESSQQKDNSKRRSQKSKPKNNRGNNQSSQSAPADNWGNSHSMRTGNRGGSTDAW